MKLTLKNAIVVATVAIIARLSSYFYFNSVTTPTIEEFSSKVVETIAAIVLPVAIAFYVSKNKSETYQRNAILILFVLLVAYVSNGIMQDRKNKEEITQLINIVNLTLDGKEITALPDSTNLQVNAARDFTVFTNNQRQKSQNNTDQILLLMPKALSAEMYVDKGALDVARQSAVAISEIAQQQIALADETSAQQLEYLKQLESKYGVKLEAIREGVFVGAARNNLYYKPSMQTVIEMMGVIEKLHNLIERNYGYMKIDANGVEFANEADDIEYKLMFEKLNQLDQKVIAYETQMQKELEKARKQINLTK